MLNSRSAIALMAALAFSAGAAPALAYKPQVLQVPASAAKPGNRGRFNDAVLPTTASHYGRKSAGITMASQKRAARKSRNVARNRRSHR
jgi:hypothetical protein